MDKLFTVYSYLKYRLNAENEHGIHSPFVFELYMDVIRDRALYYEFDVIESLRAKHLLDKKKITITDFGTGKNGRQERICDIAKRSLNSPKYAQLLFRLAKRFNPENILELGTSLGITSLYLSLPNKNNHFITLEGCQETAALAQQNFNKMRRNNINIICGEFGESLPNALKEFSQLDLVYFDGNHQKNATISYFEQCINLSTENSVFIFDDIYWNKEMNLAWKEIKENKAVTLTIDLFQLGLVFFRKGMIKQDFTLLC